MQDVIKILRENNEVVPIPMRLPSESEVLTLEKKLSIHFPSDFKGYLLKVSDVVFGTIEPVTITDPSCYTYFKTVLDDARTCGVDNNLIPICYNNGDFYCMESDGRIVFWSHNGVVDESWDNIWDWVNDVWLVS